MSDLDPITFEWDHDDRKSTVLFSEYVENLVDELKDTVPPSARSWNPEERTWTISSDWVDTITEIAESHGLEEA